MQNQWYDPYGKPRGTATITTTDRGYIGQYEDTTTGLGYLNNRYQDPATGVFLSVDPLVQSTGEPYLYGSGNPTTLSDPLGLCANTPSEAAACFGAPAVVAGAYQMAANGSDQNQIMNYLLGHPSYTDTRGGRLGAETHAVFLSNDALTPSRTPPFMPPIHDAPRLWDDIVTGFDKGSPGGGVMGCAGLDGSAGSGTANGTASGSSCIMVDSDGVAVMATVGAGPSVGAPGLSGSAGVGVGISNADAEALSGWGMCGNVSGGAGFGGAGALCGSIYYNDVSSEWSYSGAWTLYGGMSVTTPSWSGGNSYTYTWVNHWSWPWS